MQLGRRGLMLGLAVAAAEFGSLSARASRYDLGAPPVRYPDADIKTIDPRFSSLVLGNAAIERIATGCRLSRIVLDGRLAQMSGADREYCRLVTGRIICSR